MNKYSKEFELAKYLAKEGIPYTVYADDETERLAFIVNNKQAAKASSFFKEQGEEESSVENSTHYNTLVEILDIMGVEHKVTVGAKAVIQFAHSTYEKDVDFDGFTDHVQTERRQEEAVNTLSERIIQDICNYGIHTIISENK